MFKKILPSMLPIIQGPMVGSFSPLTIAVCEAGGLGSLACAALTPDSLREQIAHIRAGTTAPFNINFFCHTPPEKNTQIIEDWGKLLAPYYEEIGLDLSAMQTGAGRAPFDDAMCSVIEETKPAVVSFHFGLPNKGLLARVKQTGAMILSSATSVKEAIWLEEQGVDAIIAQGNEAGGHRGMFLTEDIHAQPGLFALLPQIVDAVSVPVIAAGGIADGRGIAAALALGASAVQIGTAYLLTPQAGRSAIHKQAIKEAQDDSTRLTNLYTGRPARGLLTRFMREQGPMNTNAPAFSLATGVVDPLKLAFEKAGKNDFSQLWAGEAAALAREKDAGDLTTLLWDEALQRITQLQK
jgi:nitronate monooxygenase